MSSDESEIGISIIRGVLALEWPHVKDVDCQSEAKRFLTGSRLTGNALASHHVVINGCSFETGVHAFSYYFYDVMKDRKLHAYARRFLQEGSTAQQAVEWFGAEAVACVTGLSKSFVLEKRREVMRKHGLHIMAYTMVNKFVSQPWCVEALCETQGQLVVSNSFSVWKGSKNALGRMYMDLREHVRKWLSVYACHIPTMSRSDIQTNLREYLFNFMKNYESEEP